MKTVKPDKTDEQAAALIEARSEVLKLRAQLKRTEEERDILKKAAVGSTCQCNRHIQGLVRCHVAECLPRPFV